MKYRKNWNYLIIGLIICNGFKMPISELETELLVIGGGTSGVCAALQAARQGTQVVLVEETEWLGGMLTAAGVSATDGNHHLPSGLWGEFRQKLYQHYGGEKELKTGWVSNTLFEPHVGNEVFHELIYNEPNITLLKKYHIREVIKTGDRVHGVKFINQSGEELIVHSRMSIDATEYGDLLNLAGCDYHLGRDSRELTGEPEAPAAGDDIIQDLTYAVILKDFGSKADKTIFRPENYDPEIFRDCCKEWSRTRSNSLVSARTMLDYGRLPNGKYMINWPIEGNDYYANIIESAREQRRKILQEAKNHSLCFVYFLQTELGFKNLGLADDEFPTADLLPLIPYNRESRRVRGITTLTTNDIVNPYKNADRPLYKYGIAVGDYPLDHHHGKGPLIGIESFPKIPAFTIPYGCLVPREIKGLLVAEKNISVTHLINGCTRLQPVVMLLGQAAGAAASLCVQKQIEPADLSVRDLQQMLLENDCWLMPFGDISPDNWAFKSVQRIAVCGLIRGEGIPGEWANEFRFYPDREITRKEVLAALNQTCPDQIERFKSILRTEEKSISRLQALHLLWQLIGKPLTAGWNLKIKDLTGNAPEYNAVAYFDSKNMLTNFIKHDSLLPDRALTRREFACLLDVLFDPFHNLTLPREDFN